MPTFDKSETMSSSIALAVASPTVDMNSVIALQCSTFTDARALGALRGGSDNYGHGDILQFYCVRL